jgi:hypothetical protein
VYAVGIASLGYPPHWANTSGEFEQIEAALTAFAMEVQ